MKQKNYKKDLQVDIKELMESILINWKYLFVTVICCAVIFAIIGYFKTVEVTKTLNISLIEKEKKLTEELAETQIKDIETSAGIIKEYEKMSIIKEEYLENSLFMKINSNSVHSIIMEYSVEIENDITGGETKKVLAAYQNELKEIETFEKICKAVNSEWGPNYLSEIIDISTVIEIEDGSISNYDFLQVSIKGENLELVKSIAREMDDIISNKNIQLSEVLAKHKIKLFSEAYSVFADPFIFGKQKNNKEELIQINNQIISMKTGYLEPSASYLNFILNADKQEDIKNVESQIDTFLVVKYIIFGVSIGIMLFLFLHLFSYFCSDIIHSVEELKKYFSIKVLGEIKKRNWKKKNYYSWKDKSFRKDTLGYIRISQEENIELIAKAIQLTVKNNDKKNLLLMGCGLDAEEIEVITSIKAKLVQGKIELVYVQEEYLQQLFDAEGIILLVRLRKTTFKEIGKIMEFFDLQHKPVDGFLIIE